MKLSARNQFAGQVVRVQEGIVNGIVTLDFNGGTISGTISLAAIKELGLAEGKKAVAIVKATEVMIGLGAMNLSARNQFPGAITQINEGGVNNIVTVELASGIKVSATISKNAVDELGLTVGKNATAVIKATSVMFAVE